MDKLNNTEKENLKCLFGILKKHESRLTKVEERQKIEAFKLNHLLKNWWKTEMEKKNFQPKPTNQ